MTNTETIACTYCPAAWTPDHMPTAHPEVVAAVYARRARDGRRRRAAERGRDWRKVR